MDEKPKRYIVADFGAITPLRCPCGFTRRAFTEDPDGVATVHVVEIQEDARVHYHRKLTEVYFVLEGEGILELDEESLPVRPRSCVMIKPGCRHRAVGQLTMLVTAIPAFDPEDEWFDEQV
ncbi:MAG: cupin domain-containing protein [candidate division WS1 bacterium]|jgi:mannose-6-phosphate isomerase-like protein (cupin superfamily)|nr:cupin domain-containing protein [candidate division WS1 bacterium]